MRSGWWPCHQGRTCYRRVGWSGDGAPGKDQVTTARACSATYPAGRRGSTAGSALAREVDRSWAHVSALYVVTLIFSCPELEPRSRSTASRAQGAPITPHFGPRRPPTQSPPGDGGPTAWLQASTRPAQCRPASNRRTKCTHSWTGDQRAIHFLVTPVSAARSPQGDRGTRPRLTTRRHRKTLSAHCEFFVYAAPAPTRSAIPERTPECQGPRGRWSRSAQPR